MVSEATQENPEEGEGEEIVEEVEGEAEEKNAPAAETQTTETKPAIDEIKIMLFLKGNRAMVGIQSPECDPVLTTLEGDLTAVLPRVPAIVENAKAKWNESRRYPKAVLPEPPAPPPPPARSSRPTKTETKTKVQPSFF
jgi:hypothetical protein